MQSARKRFGQHFLEPAWVDKVVDAIAPAAGRDLPRDRTGPRRAHAAARGARRRRVVAFEIDRDLAAALAPAAIRRTSRSSQGDFLDVRRSPDSRDRPAPAPLRVAGNLPYNVASPILFKLLELYARACRVRGRDADAAARGRRPPRGAAGHEGLRRADASLIGVACRRRAAADAAAGRVPAAAEGARRRSSGCAFTRPPPVRATCRTSSRRWSRPSSRGAGRRSANALLRRSAEAAGATLGSAAWPAPASTAGGGPKRSRSPNSSGSPTLLAPPA